MQIRRETETKAQFPNQFLGIAQAKNYGRTNDEEYKWRNWRKRSPVIRPHAISWNLSSQYTIFHIPLWPSRPNPLALVLYNSKITKLHNENKSKKKRRKRRIVEMKKENTRRLFCFHSGTDSSPLLTENTAKKNPSSQIWTKQATLAEAPSECTNSFVWK